MRTLSALTDWALEGSIVTGDSMRARGYGTAKRTSFQIYRMKALDWTLLAVMLTLAGVAAVAAAMGGAAAEFTPKLAIQPVTGIYAPGFSCLLRLPLYSLCTTHEGGRSMAHIEIENLTFSYPSAGRPSLSDVSLTIRRGEYVVLCGKSGSGKNNAAAAPENGACAPRKAKQGTSASTAFR